MECLIRSLVCGKHMVYPGQALAWRVCSLLWGDYHVSPSMMYRLITSNLSLLLKLCFCRDWPPFFFKPAGQQLAPWRCSRRSNCHGPFSIRRFVVLVLVARVDRLVSCALAMWNFPSRFIYITLYISHVSILNPPFAPSLSEHLSFHFCLILVQRT
jgi:hypothetical protein